MALAPPHPPCPTHRRENYLYYATCDGGATAEFGIYPPLEASSCGTKKESRISLYGTHIRTPADLGQDDIHIQIPGRIIFFIFHLSSLKKPDTYPMFSSHRFLFCTVHPTILHHSSIIRPGTSISTPTYTPVLSYIYQGKLWGGYDGRPRARARITIRHMLQ